MWVLSKGTICKNLSLIYNWSVAAEGAAVEDERGSGLYPQSVCSLSAADVERQREAADEDSHTRDRRRLLPERRRTAPAGPQDR